MIAPDLQRKISGYLAGQQAMKEGRWMQMPDDEAREFWRDFIERADTLLEAIENAPHDETVAQLPQMIEDMKRLALRECPE